MPSPEPKDGWTRYRDRGVLYWCSYISVIDFATKPKHSDTISRHSYDLLV